ncbi:tyrosine-type recombinase/integrase [Leisingera sp. ANG-DT]|uniref:tyrosine-type recombinase/integrase n=1 Tax=Leisingera sp. ANG-DT TaxID=1577897 RepID=UPI000580675D|nr:site-specific integrase [Leisingera sp. ANG-DT]KIC18505.1 integrase [Leisingera sp. ANG-DT]
MAINRLAAAQLKRLPPGKHCDGGGLYFIKRDDGGAQWVYRYSIYQRRKEMGLGSWQDISLKQAREAAQKWRAVKADSKDPIKEREREKRIALKSDHSLETIALAAFEAKKAELKGDGQAGRWFSPLQLHILPKLGKTPVQEIDQQDVKNVLSKIWHEKAPTATKAINRLGIVMRHALAMGLDVDPAVTDKAKILLGKQRHTEEHIKSLAWQQVPEFYASLDEGTVTHLALRFLILTAVRSGPIRIARWDQIEGSTWTIPAEVMKGRLGHTEELNVPLSAEAMAILKQVRPFEREGWIFPGVRKGTISNQTMSKLMKTRGMDERPHGFRSSFDTWCAETQDVSFQISKAALGHKFDSKVGRAYRRTDFLEKRRVLMEAWASHVSGENCQVIKIAHT